ncbi:hypothetical protein ACH4SP_25850 [Streptomyces sp. NPDC021093]|uniref:hypothetical protein n=1 Tax=Streptomyces sp. NPDC021093 TaxID=3365112 RepID=UPI00378FC44A
MTSDARTPSDPPQGETYGTAVKRLLAAAGRTQTEFAAAQGLTQTKVSRALDNKFSTYSPTDPFHASVLDFLGLDRDSEQARYLEPLYEAARNPNGVSYWQDQTSRLRLTVDQLSWRVEEALQGRSEAQDALSELQEQVDRLSAETKRTFHVLEEENDVLRARTADQETQLDRAAAYAREQEDERQAAEEKARALGQEVSVLQHQVRLLQEEKAGHQPITRVARGTSYEEAIARYMAHHPGTPGEPYLAHPYPLAAEEPAEQHTSTPAPPPADSDVPPIKVLTSRSLREQGHLYCLAALAAGLSLTALTAAGFFAGAFMSTHEAPRSGSWREVGVALSFWQWDWTTVWHGGVLLLALIEYFGFWHLLYEKAYWFMFGFIWTASPEAGLTPRLVFRLSRLAYPGSGRLDPKAVMLVYGALIAVVLSMTADLAPLGQRINDILNSRAPAKNTPSTSHSPSASVSPAQPVKDPVADIGDQPVNTAPIMKLPVCDNHYLIGRLTPPGARFTTAHEPRWTLTVRVQPAEGMPGTCCLDASRSELVLQVHTPSDEPAVWKSSWCTSGQAAPRWLQLTQTTSGTVDFRWNRRTAVPGCTSTKAVPSGSYVASVSVVDGEWWSESFRREQRSDSTSWSPHGPGGCSRADTMTKELLGPAGDCAGGVKWVG